MNNTEANNPVYRPFSAYPDVEAWFPSDSMETSRAQIARCVERSEGLALIFGSAGLGKSLLLRRLARDFEEEYAVVRTLTPIRTSKSLLQHILAGLHQTWCGCDENELRLFLADYLQKNGEQKLILLIDEAQTLPLAAFEDIRALLDLGTDHAPLVSIVMAATPRLEERLTRHAFAPFNQRIVSRNYLEPFNSAETAQYIEAQLSKSPQTSRFMPTVEARRLIHQYADGVPRVINQLCDLMLWGIAREEKSGSGTAPVTEGARLIDEQDVQFWWHQLQQLDAGPVTASSRTKEADASRQTAVAAGAVIEFGSLDDESEDQVTAVELSADEICPMAMTGPETEAEEQPETDLITGSATNQQHGGDEVREDATTDILSFGGLEEEESTSPQDEADDTELFDTEDDTEREPEPENREPMCRFDAGHVANTSPRPQHQPASTPPISMEERYLKELQQLEGEVSLEASLIRQLRDIHLHLKDSHSTAYELAGLSQEEVPAAREIPSDALREDIRNYLRSGQEPAKPKKPSQFDAVFRQIYEK
ncbi:MAG: AAA family ATPase [Planctomycetia bacterium]|nr:AAA family ATPase [Planctomycetia bacterium]